MISCGEASGDMYAGALVRALQRLAPGTTAFGFGGAKLAEAGATLIGDYHGFSVTGLTEAVSVLRKSWKMLDTLGEAARIERPDVFVAVDFPDFNFRLLKVMHRLDIPIVYYISPQLWAWRPARIKLMKRSVDRVLPIFPFEAEIYRRQNMDVRFVGHPLIDLAKPQLTRDAFLRTLNLDPSKPVLALLPGSRKNELERLAPVIAKAVPAIAAQVPGVQFVVARAPNLDDGLFESFGLSGVTLRIADGRTDDVLNACDAVVTASGTATVQTALHGKPMVVLYKLSPTTYRLGKGLARVDMYAMVNLIAGRRIVVELIQDDCTPDGVTAEAVRIMTDQPYRAAMIAALDDVRRQLGGPGASDRAAEAILEMVPRVP